MGPGGPTLDAVGVLESLEKLKNKFSFWPEKNRIAGLPRVVNFQLCF
jgi:hypothetical protein